jgi:anaerobic dimethyl sulfoxide reductase subunit B (iron-sulfur subunit)
MTNHYAFYFDSTACSGCKACQVACKDKHGLEVGRLWRRVYEVSGGDWLSVGEAWIHNIFAYNVSSSCNHCERAICMEVCPTRAIQKREDGIVLIDEKRCVGCEYCSWACPYDALQYDMNTGRMSKCTLCYDEVDIGKAPACVSACPLRVLDFGNLHELKEKYGVSTSIFPLPDPALTDPSLVITPHKDARRATTEPAQISNLEEV